MFIESGNETAHMFMESGNETAHMFMESGNETVFTASTYTHTCREV